MSDKKIIGIYPMVADILHVGHIVALEQAKSQCDKLVVCLHCNPNYKKPIQSIYERYIQLSAVKYVDEVIPYADENDMENLLKSYNYDIYFLGSDHKNENFQCKEVLEKLNKKIVYLERNHDYSSTYFKMKGKEAVNEK